MEWISIKDQMPDKVEKILIFQPFAHPFFQVGYVKAMHNATFKRLVRQGEITHWLKPLPPGL